MKKIFFTCLLSFLAIIACEGPQNIVFKNMTDVRVTDITNKNITLEANAILNNPNVAGVNLVGTDVVVTVEGTEVGRAVQTAESVEIPALSDFAVPLSTKFPLKKLSKGGILGTALSVLTKNKIEVEYTGKVTVRIMDVDFDIPVDHKQEIPLR